MTAEADLAFDHVREPAEDPDYVALLLHGTGADQHDLVPLGRQLAPEQTLLSPLGKVREDGMPRWFERHGEGDLDEASIHERAAELARFLDEARQAYDADPDRFVAIGFSNGANIAAALLLLHPRALRGAVLLRAMTPLEPDPLPDLQGVPVHVASGRRDRLIAPDDARNLARLLSQAGADVTHRFADAGHQLTRAEVSQARRWLNEHRAQLATPRGGAPP